MLVMLVTMLVLIANVNHVSNYTSSNNSAVIINIKYVMNVH